MDKKKLLLLEEKASELSSLIVSLRKEQYESLNSQFDELSQRMSRMEELLLQVKSAII